ncbi:MAG: hypothetical protein ABL884_11255 [Methyloglobulus sp.]
MEIGLNELALVYFNKALNLANAGELTSDENPQVGGALAVFRPAGFH